MGELLTPSFPDNYISALALSDHPFSCGSVHIRSADPLEKPIFDPNYLSRPIDLENPRRHTQYLDRIPDPEGADVTDLESAKKIVKNRLLSCFHPAGTCAMMPEELGGVVNNRLIVHGTKNLRVVDASIFPMEPHGNIQATVYAVAEKAADMIKQDSTDLWSFRGLYCGFLGLLHSGRHQQATCFLRSVVMASGDDKLEWRLLCWQHSTAALGIRQKARFFSFAISFDCVLDLYSSLFQQFRKM
ncbi:hypothetical protein VTN00DRAFT_8031 [Thermoascus crustaceus]|uniref:uncharacterized protein n=1 Tax=Thermoascus crustaceus TaxID=5088 RepID=UPI00374384B1